MRARIAAPLMMKTNPRYSAMKMTMALEPMLSSMISDRVLIYINRIFFRPAHQRLKLSVVHVGAEFICIISFRVISDQQARILLFLREFHIVRTITRPMLDSE